jgi:hypothetical protein
MGYAFLLSGQALIRSVVVHDSLPPDHTGLDASRGAAGTRPHQRRCEQHPGEHP